MRWFRRFIDRLRRLWAWIPVIWKLHDWDYMYAIEVFKFQLNRTADYLDSDKAHLEHADMYAKRIRFVLKFMDDVYEEEKYMHEYSDIMKERYGELWEQFWRGKLEITESNRDLVAKMQREQSELFRKSMKKQEKAHRLLWMMIDHDIQKWWD